MFPFHDYMFSKFILGKKIWLNELQPSDGISKVVFGGQVTDEEVESLNKRYEIYLFLFQIIFVWKKALFIYNFLLQ